MTVTGIEGLQRQLLGDEPQLHGLRDVQNWIGGSDYHPLAAEFVPPAPHLVPALVSDLVDYSNGGDHAPLVQAGLCTRSSRRSIRFGTVTAGSGAR